MAWSCGIVGLPNAGKSSLFKALTSRDVLIESYPFSTIDPNKAVVAIPDHRLGELSMVCKSEKSTSATMEIIDVAGLVSGASRGEGLGNQFLGHLRNTDLLIHVVAGYDLGIKELMGRAETVDLELNFADLAVIERRREKLEPKLKGPERKEAAAELQLLGYLEEHLNMGRPLRTLSLTTEEKSIALALSLLTLKEMIYLYNHGESEKPATFEAPHGNTFFPFCASLEAEVAYLPPEEKAIYLEAYGVDHSRAEQLLKECYRLLNLITFYTVKGAEARAWVVTCGIKAIEAAGKIHSDMEKGFINVEVMPWDLLIEEGGPSKAREKGLSKTEGRDYPVKDGDVLFFRFRP